MSPRPSVDRGVPPARADSGFVDWDIFDRASDSLGRTGGLLALMLSGLIFVHGGVTGHPPDGSALTLAAGAGLVGLALLLSSIADRLAKIVRSGERKG